jgi:hypothetical protein
MRCNLRVLTTTLFCTLVAMPGVAQSLSPVSLAETGFLLRLPTVEKVAFRGMVDPDKAGGNNAYQMAYPGGAGLAGFLVAIATHGVIEESAKNSRKAQAQEAANKVLDSFGDAISSFSNRELMQLALDQLSIKGASKLIEATDISTSGWIVESAPVFTLTQDKSALVLEVALTIYSANVPSAGRYQNTIRVVSNARVVSEPVVSDTQQGMQIRQDSVDLFVHSINIALREVARLPDSNVELQKTFRYQEGNVGKMERGQLLFEGCNRVLIRTLRGWIMSIPQLQSNGAVEQAQCSKDDQYALN